LSTVPNVTNCLDSRARQVVFRGGGHLSGGFFLEIALVDAGLKNGGFGFIWLLTSFAMRLQCSPFPMEGKESHTLHSANGSSGARSGVGGLVKQRKQPKGERK